MAQQVISIGGAANDGTGDPLRTAFNKINQNFSEIYATGTAGSNLDISDNDISATNTNGDINLIPDGTGTVNVDGGLTINGMILNGVLFNSNADRVASSSSLTFDGSELVVADVTISGNTISSTGTSEVGNDLILSAYTDKVVINGFAEIAGLRISNNEIVAIAANTSIILDPTGTGNVILASGKLVIAASATPVNTGSLGDVAGMITWASGFIYVCTANYDGVTAIWKRATLASY